MPPLHPFNSKTTGCRLKGIHINHLIRSQVEAAELKKRIPGFPNGFYEDLLQYGRILSFPPDQVVLKEGSYVNVIPIVLNGLVKVTIREEDKEILLYYIEQGQSCVMSFSACITNTQSKIYATTEEESELLLVPSDRLMTLMAKYPSFANYFFTLYQQRYENLVHSIDLLVFKNFDERLINYLRERCEKAGVPILKTTHQEIASDLGTLREVVSRAIKKLEREGKVSLTRNEIRVLFSPVTKVTDKP